MQPETIGESARRAVRRCDDLAHYSEEGDRLTRRYGTPALRQAQETVAEWMRAAGMQVRRDSIGNLIGRYDAAQPDAPVMLLGSHLDSVRDAGNYDGPLGVMTALACVERLHTRGERLPCAIEVLAFADEEGVRFSTAYLGSQVIAGGFDAALLDRTDADGITLRDAIVAFGGTPATIADDSYRGRKLLGYCEVHIEQGPVLETEDQPVGIVSAIQGMSRVDLVLRGTAGHAGTVPMALRHDALCAAAEVILAIEDTARSINELVATVGQIDSRPGAANVIPGLTTISLDLRHPDDAARHDAQEQIRQRAVAIAERRGVSLDWRALQDNPSVPCTSTLINELQHAVMAAGYPVRLLPSGAGHDSVPLSALCPVAMLFVRCKGGVSHNPAESVKVDDVAVALDVIERLVAQMGSHVAADQ